MTRSTHQPTTFGAAELGASAPVRARLPGRGVVLRVLDAHRPGAVAHDLGLEGRDDGSPVRLRRNGCQPKAVGLYFSVKSGQHLPFESGLELHDLWHAEVCTDVVRSWAQPFTLRYVLEGRLHQYTPDRQDLLADGTARVIEVKDDATEDVADIVGPLLRIRGMHYSVHRRAAIVAEPRFAAVDVIQRNRRAAVLSDHVAAVERRLAVGPSSFAELLEALPCGPAGFAIACALVVRRIIRIDLEAGLTPASTVTLVRPC